MKNAEKTPSAMNEDRRHVARFVCIKTERLEDALTGQRLMFHRLYQQPRVETIYGAL